MKSAFAVAVLAALCEAASAVSAARVFTYDPHTPARPHLGGRELEPVAARLVLAQRAHVQEYHSSDLDRQEIIDAINEFGVKTPLFGKASGKTKTALLLLENVAEAAMSSSALSSYTSFQVKSAPSCGGLFVDLARQVDATGLSSLSDAQTQQTISGSQHVTENGDIIFRTASIEELENTFARLVKQDTWSITALITCRGGDSESADEPSVWGTYEMPSQQFLKKRAVKEQPLIEKKRPESSSNKASLGALAKKNATIIRGILPACFHSLAECERRTQNCSGHGQCRKEYHDKSAPVPYDCFSCKCGNTTTKHNDLISTTYWSGPACQKKDVSVEFWLIVLFTVGLVFLIGFAVGQIWEMGDEQLPSVIGAGVSGPTARK